MSESRREFIKKTAAGSAAVMAGGILPGFSARSYGRIPGANERIRVSVMGVNSRGLALAMNFARQEDCDVIHICDVDSRALQRCMEAVSGISGQRPAGFGDFRESLEDPGVDALVIAAPDHWHAPASLLAMQAGKHVYVEKPCSHNPNEGEMLVEAAARYGRVVQMGNQRRSWPRVMEAIARLQQGVIGRPYFAKAWYANNRGTMGHGTETAVPGWLDWELWQGPAPRKPYRDNLVHYNWHWIWHWGTGEALNNGTHTVDLMRWGLGVNYPVRISSSGGRYRYDDDWETPDTQVIGMDFDEGVSMVWEGRSCNGKEIEGTSTGVLFFGETGSMLIPGGDSYTIFGLDGTTVEKVTSDMEVDPLNPTNPAELLDALHIRNFFDGIRGRAPLNAAIDSGYISTLLVQLGNISHRTGRSLDIDPATGHILGDRTAAKYWSRSYEKGWEMKL